MNHLFFSYAIRHNYAIKFLKSFLNIWIVGNLIVGWAERVIKQSAGILHQIYRFSVGVNICRSKIHQSKSWYYLGPSQISKVELHKLFSAQVINCFCKKLELRCLTSSIRLSRKRFYVLLVKILYLGKIKTT